jgi:hypothetical protein
VFNSCVYKDPADPSFKGTFTAKAAEFLENLDKTFLQNVLSFFGITCITQANGKHSWGEPAIQFFLHTTVAFNAS